jgi:hypothetical protein
MPLNVTVLLSWWQDNSADNMQWLERVVVLNDLVY